jgi:general secretion pathway protein J
MGASSQNLYHEKTMNKIKGYTLIEVLIALTVFTVLTAISTSAIQKILERYRILHTNYQQWYQIDKVCSALQNQTQSYASRAIKTAGNRQFPAFIGQHNYTEWTYVRPPQQQLARIGYLCQGEKLIQRQWTQVDAPERNDFQQKVLLSHLTECRFRYMNIKHQSSGHWDNEQGMNPIGVQLMLAWNSKQKLQLWFSLPPYTYEIQSL